MASPKAAWGIEIGAYAIKAIRLEREGDNATVSDFVVIPHKKVLTTPDLDRDEMVRLGLGQFISQKSLENEHLVMSVPGHSAFARFAKLPPVEPKKVPDIVKFEAVQQIPFPIDQVEWDYQTFTSADSPETEVGIFAITRDRVQHMLNLYGELGVSPERLTLSPVAVYNAMAFDHEVAQQKAPVMYLDIGTQATDVIIANEGRCWIRTFPLGGSHFTEAIASAFKLSYSKAEKLKLEAATSKYAKQIMQAMRPVFSDLLQDLQRSIGYYHSLHREAELNTIIGLGSTFKIPGLRKFIGQQLQVNVLRLDEYKKIAVTGREAASFAEHAVNFATAYGLALQGVGLAQIDANLVPVASLREQLWRGKTMWFGAAAAIIIVGAAMTLYRPFVDGGAVAENPPSVVQQVMGPGKQYKQQYESIRSGTPSTAAAANMQQLLDYRDIWPHLLDDAASALKSTNPQPELLAADKNADIPAEQSRLVELKALNAQYTFDSQSKSRRMLVTMSVELTHSRPEEFLVSNVAPWLRNNAEREGVPYRIIHDTIKTNPQQLQRLTVADSGALQSVAGGNNTNTGNPSGGGWNSGSSTPTPNDPRTGGNNPGAGSGGLLGDGGGTANKRRDPTQNAPLRAPGPGSGVAGTGSSGGNSTPNNLPQPGYGGRGQGGFLGAGADPQQNNPQQPGGGNLDQLAPMPNAPQHYEPGETVYRVPITFEIEIITTGKQPAPDATASAGSEVNS